MQIIELNSEHRGGGKSTSFTGRPEGKSVRENLRLSEFDRSEDTYSIKIPNDTTSFNPSFYLGLFYESITLLKWELFQKKYIFDLSNMPDELRLIIEGDLQECERKAKNELSGLTGLDL